MTRDFGRHAYGVAAILFGAATMFWHDLNDWQQIKALGNVPFRESVVFVAAAAALAGGFAIQWRRSAQLGALVLGVLYLFLALFWIPPIIHAPLMYDRWGNFFEPFSIFSGALIVYASLASSEPLWATRAARIGRIFFGIGVVSFMLYQAFYLHVTADLVPKWVPAGQMFWAITTTIAFALAAIAILSGRRALLASRLLTAMLLLFGFLIWLPALFAEPRSHFNWSENDETLAIAAVSWILADYLAREDRLATPRI